ncbi:MAG TPA: ATP-dependent DNA helicase [Vicinamibacterales bacterium]|nr:ATP-dependent DNA helicase [Vicinamibacterales bacterium]
MNQHSDEGAPEHPRTLAAAAGSVFSDSGPIAHALPGFEPRHGQRRMAAAVASAIEGGATLLAEAGTGTGKTLAYLVPAILSGQRALVSTGTKNLQEQIFFKDLPALREALGVSFTATLMKGRSNYLCLHRWESYRDSADDGVPGRLYDTGERVLLPMIQAWAATTTTGDRAELRDLPEDLPMWKEISAEADTCLGVECPRYGDCFLTLMRQRAAESDIVIVNHHLLCADASVRKSAFGEVIPSCSSLIVDEAHQLEDVATQYFGVSVSNFRVDDLVRDGQRLPGHAGFGEETEEVARALTRVADRARIFFSALSLSKAASPGAAESRARYTPEAISEYAEDGFMLAGALEGLEATLALMSTGGRGEGAGGSGQGAGGRDQELSDPRSPIPDPAVEVIASLQRRAGELRSDLRFLLRADDPDFVYYFESRGRGMFLRASPVDVSRIVREALFDRFHAVVLTSATLAVDGSFDYIKGRLGISSSEDLCVPSEFDYRRQALLYLPRRMPPPKSPSFPEAVARETIALLTRSRGRAFVLFTSYRVLREVQPLLQMALPYPTLVQGTAPRSALLDEFRSTPHAVLLATSSFWQGVDVVGEALSCVVIDKLPFASPGDPVTAARIDAITARGGDAFSEYQVPLAILSLQQGLGRLIRHRSDQGVLAVLDPRLRTMGYGRRFLASLPPAPLTHDLDAVGRFFK